jgi:hypothetical protein
MVADLLERSDEGEDLAAPGDPLRLLDAAHRLVHCRLVERGLL